MITRHTLQAVCRCPKNGRLDSYTVVVEVSDDVLLVEDIENIVSEFQGASVYQEEFTGALAKRLNARIRTVGMHGMIKTECEAP